MMTNGEYIDEISARNLGKFILENRDYISKHDLIKLLEVIITNYGDFGGFYDGYADKCYEDVVLEPLGEVLFEKDLDENDIKRIFRLLEKDDYNLMNIILNIFLKHAEKFSKYSDVLKKCIDEYDYFIYLIKLGKKDEVLKQLDKSDLEESEKFEILTMIDEVRQ